MRHWSDPSSARAQRARTANTKLCKLRGRTMVAVFQEQCFEHVEHCLEQWGAREQAVAHRRHMIPTSTPTYLVSTCTLISHLLAAHWHSILTTSMDSLQHH